MRQLSDGRILYHFYIDDELGLRTLGIDYVEVNGEGHMYCVPKRALYTEKRETTSLADSEQEVDLEVCGAWARASGVDEELTHIWIGQGEDAILLWEKGMDLPAASAADEAQWGFREASAAYWRIFGRRTTAARRRCRERNGSDLEQSAEDGRGRDPA